MTTPQLLTSQAANAMSTGTRGIVIVYFGSEIVNMLIDMRWALMLLILLVVADFRFGWGESAKRYADAERQHNQIFMDHYKWHTSRAVRRTLNKLADYVVILFLSGVVGMALLEPLGVQHQWGAWAGAAIACMCETISIFGHFFFLHGVKVEEKTLQGFFKALVVAFAKHKDPDVGESIEEAFEETEKKQKEQKGQK